MLRLFIAIKVIGIRAVLLTLKFIIKDKHMWSWMLGVKSYFFLGAGSFMQLHAAFVKMRLLEMVETV